MASGRGWLAGDWPSTGGVLNITAVAWTVGFQWWRCGDITRMHNVSESLYAYLLFLCDAESNEEPRDAQRHTVNVL